MFQKIMQMFQERPRLADVLALSAFVILATYQPFYLHQDINVFENGLYLPGIDAVLKGLVPYRDFFHLRGPLELYIPALFMKIFGMQFATLATYFYIGNVLTLILALVIAKEVIPSRWSFYLLVFVLSARTFPVFVYTFWGGARYVLGLLFVLAWIYGFKFQKRFWFVLSGVFACAGFFTSIDIGVCAFLCALCAAAAAGLLKDLHSVSLKQAGKSFGAGIMVVLIPLGAFFLWQHAWGDFADALFHVVFSMKQVFPSDVSFSLFSRDVFGAMMPWSSEFKYATPLYTYIFAGMFWIYKLDKKNFHARDFFAVTVALYGFFLYLMTFRIVKSSQFEMALQPEKIILFYLLTYFILRIGRQQKKTWLAVLILLAFTISSAGYAFARLNKKHFVGLRYVKRLLLRQDTQDLNRHKHDVMIPLNLKRARGVKVNVGQAKEMEAFGLLLNDRVPEGERILVYPEGGAYYFLGNRPFTGRFPIATLSWFSDRWHKEFLQDIEAQKPAYAFLFFPLHAKWEQDYFAIESNRKKYDDVITYVKKHYTLKAQTKTFQFYKRIDRE